MIRKYILIKIMTIIEIKSEKDEIKNFMDLDEKIFHENSFKFFLYFLL